MTDPLEQQSEDAMKAAFEKWCPYKGSPDPWVVWQVAFQAGLSHDAKLVAEKEELLLHYKTQVEVVQALCNRRGRTIAEQDAEIAKADATIELLMNRNAELHAKLDAADKQEPADATLSTTLDTRPNEYDAKVMEIAADKLD